MNMQLTGHDIAQGVSYCTKCSVGNRKDAKYCKNCGEKLFENISSANVVKTKGDSMVNKVVRLIVLLFGAALANGIFNPSPTVPNIPDNDYSTHVEQPFVVDIVAEVKKQTMLPSKIDDSTMLVDVTAEPNAIRYHYTLLGLDTSQLKNSDFKSMLAPSLCNNEKTRVILDYNINMEYSYIVKETNQTFFTSISKSDCSS